MAFQYNVKQFFTFKRITPPGIQQDNLIQFSYHSKDTPIHDRNPLVYVIEKGLKGFYGLNLHYNQNMLVELIDATNEKVDIFLQEQWLKKDKKNQKILSEADDEFNRGWIKPLDLKSFVRKMPKNDLEQFLIESEDDGTFRQYLYKRMNSVSKLVYKVNQ